MQLETTWTQISRVLWKYISLCWLHSSLLVTLFVESVWLCWKKNQSICHFPSAQALRIDIGEMYSALLSTRRTRLLIFLQEKTLSIFNRMTSSFLFLLILSAFTCILSFYHCRFSCTSLSRPNPLHFAIVIFLTSRKFFILAPFVLTFINKIWRQIIESGTILAFNSLQ